MSNNCVNCDPVPNGSTIIITEAQEPYCEQCGDDSSVCNEKMDAKCVVYHLRDCSLPSHLDFLGLPSCTDLETILESLNALIGNTANIPLTVTDTDSINLTASGSANHTLSADLILSPDTGNLLEVRDNGAFVPNLYDGKVKINSTDTPDYLINQLVGGTDGCVSISVFVEDGLVKIKPLLNVDCILSQVPEPDPETTLTVVDTNSINFTASGTAGHTLTGDVKISATAGNIISTNSDGLYASAPSSLTFQNALTNTAGIVEWGGNLVKHTLVDGTSFDVSINPRKFIVGNQYATYQGLTFSSNKVLFVDASTPPAAGHTFNATGSTLTLTNGLSLNSNAALFAGSMGLALHGQGNLTVPVGAPIAGLHSSITLDIDPTRTITVVQGNSPRAVAGFAAQTFLTGHAGISPGLITHLAGIRIIAPYQAPASGANYTQATNYYGLLIEAAGEYLQDATDITNRWGVYQAGPDRNEFHGEVRYYNGLVNASDSRVKVVSGNYTQGLTEIKQLVPKVYTYDPAYITSDKTFVGVIAQSVEGIIDHSVYQAANLGFNDFRFFDPTPILYAVINSIKQITGQEIIAYVTDTESVAYTGINNAQVGTPYAKLADLNALRVAYDNLRESYDDLRTQLITAGVLTETPL